MMNSTFNNLKQLNLRNCQNYLEYNVIGNSGVKLLVKTFLPKLQKLYICKIKLIQATAKQRARDSST